MSDDASRPGAPDQPAPLAPEWLLEPLPSPETPLELETTDSRFESISALILRGEYIDAARRSEELLHEGVHDVRVLGYYLFGYFIERGLPSLPFLFRVLVKILSNKLEGFGPTHKKQIQSENMLLWLISGVLKNVELHSTLKDQTWKQWLDPKNRPAVDEAMALCPEVQVALAGFAPQARAALRFQSLDNWLGSFGHSETGVSKRPTDSGASSAGSKESPQSKSSSAGSKTSSDSANKEPAEDDAHDDDDEEKEDEKPRNRRRPNVNDDDEEDDDDDDDSLEDDEDHEPRGARHPRLDDDHLADDERTGRHQRPPFEKARTSTENPRGKAPSAEEGSAQWQRLLDRLQAFEMLVQKGLYLKAAIVAADIQEVIASFDPVTFFPSLFAPFLESFADHMRPLEHYLNDSQSVKWKVLQKLYQVDFESFLRKN